MKKKTIIRDIFFVVIFLHIAISFVHHITKNFIFDAAVNNESGMITFLTLDYELKTYDQSGNLLYETKLTETDGGYAFLDYQGGKLFVQILRTDELWIYDESGELISKQENTKSIERAWEDWNRDSGSYCYETDTHIYCYTYPKYWRYLFSGGRDEIMIRITEKKTQKDIVLWQET